MTTDALAELDSLTARLRSPSSQSGEDPDQEGWMVSYADLITLLFIFFAVMLSISVVSKAKFDLLTQEFNQSSMTSLADLKREIDQEISKQNLVNEVSTVIGDEGLQIQFSEGVLFPSGAAEINLKGVEVLGRFGKILSSMNKEFRLAVEGHTDDRPIHTSEFESNWALSSKRSVNVLHFLAVNGLDQKRMMVRAYAATRPISESRDLNRRVTLLVY